MRKGIERFLTFIVILCVLSLASYNVLLRTGSVAASGSSAKEGVYYTQSVLYRESAILTLSISEPSGWVLLRNGEEAQIQKDEAGRYELTVYDGDVISLDLRNIADKDVSVFVAQISKDSQTPEEGTKLFLKGGIKNLFKIKISENE